MRRWRRGSTALSRSRARRACPRTARAASTNETSPTGLRPLFHIHTSTSRRLPSRLLSAMNPPHSGTYIHRCQLPDHAHRGLSRIVLSNEGMKHPIFYFGLGRGRSQGLRRTDGEPSTHAFLVIPHALTYTCIGMTQLTLTPIPPTVEYDRLTTQCVCRAEISTPSISMKAKRRCCKA